MLLSERVLEERSFKGCKRVRVGRDPRSDLLLDNLGISRSHCEFEDVGGGAWLIRDLSGGRTLVNGAKVAEHDLADGDLIQLGKFVLAVSLEGPVPIPGAAAPAAGEAVGGATLAGVSDLGREASLARPLGYLRSEQGVVELLALYTAIGKEDGCAVRLSGWFEPRLAAVFVREETAYRVVDVSPKGDAVQLAGQPCANTALSEGDEISVRGTRYTFHYGDSREVIA